MGHRDGRQPFFHSQNKENRLQGPTQVNKAPGQGSLMIIAYRESCRAAASGQERFPSRKPDGGGHIQTLLQQQLHESVQRYPGVCGVGNCPLRDVADLDCKLGIKENQNQFFFPRHRDFSLNRTRLSFIWPISSSADCSEACARTPPNHPWRKFCPGHAVLRTR
jgi:hypothetical protein